MADKIDHVIVLMMENRSFDQMLGCMKKKYQQLEGIDFANPVKLPDNNNPPTIFAQAAGSDDTKLGNCDPKHEYPNVLQQMQGNNGSFIIDFGQSYPSSSPSARQQIISYFDSGTLSVLHPLAENFCICDHWFSSLPGPTWPNRFFVHSGTSLGHVDMPSSFNPLLHVYDQPTIYELLSHHGISWRIYYGDFPQSLLLTRQWAYPFNYSRMQDFDTDAAGPADKFPTYAFIEPTYFGSGENDEHPYSGVQHGEALIARVYNAIRANQPLWESSLLIILYDEHGGFYDHMYPDPITYPAVAPDEHQSPFKFNQYGIRVPAILVSPWVQPQVLSAAFDHTSILKYVSDKWQVSYLGNRTAVANSFGSALTLLNSPRSNTPASVQPGQTVLTRSVPAPITKMQESLLSFSQFLETKMSHVESMDAIASRFLRSTGDNLDKADVAVERVERFLNYRRSIGKP